MPGSPDSKRRKPRPRRRKPRDDSIETRRRILDSAEYLFSIKGYFGASLREITQSAEVPLSLARHHFGTKAELFAAVVDRRTGLHAKHIRAKLGAVVGQAEGRPVPVKMLLRTYAEALVEFARIDEGWANFSRLAARASEWRDEDSYAAPLLDAYMPVMRDYIEEIHRSLPTLSKEDLFWSFYFFQLVLSQFIVETGIVDRLSGGLCRSSDLERVVDKMAPFFSAGFHGFA